MTLMLWLLASILLLAVAGWLYQVIGVWRDRTRYIGSGPAARGRIVELAGGCKVYVQQTRLPSASGPAAHTDALPTVIFESGIGASCQNWCELQRRVACFAPTFSYDRTGLGWSGATGGARTPSNLARELHLTLRAAGIDGPFLVVGHSFGGLIARRFATDYADVVTGLVLLDPMRPEEWPPLNESRRGTVERGARFAGYGAVAAHLGIARLGMRSLLCGRGRITGLMRRAAGKGGAHLAGRILCEMGKMPREVWPIVAAHWSSPKFFRSFAAYIRAVPRTVAEMQDAPPLTIPVTLLTPADGVPLDPEQVARIGIDVQQRIAAKSGHWVHLDEPEMVLAAIREMVGSPRRVEQASVYA
jgi:pimeloyl-ACP methyl ester carboxylesterase